MHEQVITVTSPGTQDFDFMFNAFTPIGPAGPLNLGDIDGIVLTGLITANGDISLENIETFSNVPEPASLAAWGLIGLAGASVAWRSRRRCR